MGLRDALFGRKKLPGPARDDRLFAITTAAVTLDVELGLKTAGKAAVVYKPLSAGDFTRVDSDAEALIKEAGRSSGSEVERKTDSYGFEWLLIYDDDLEDQVGSIHAVAQQLTEQGFGAQLLVAPFLFKGGTNPVYWIYGFKLGTFWPFVPTGDGEKRDNATELELKAKLEKELPVEQEITRWLALYDSPLMP
jgi:hypothetical protein